MQNSTVAPVETCPEPVPTSEDVHSEGGLKKRVPKRILHFCDGTLEEYSSDEDECKQEKVGETQLAVVNPGTLDWMPWFMHQTSNAGNKALAACDYLGEYLANFFGILSPKYEYEIEQYKKILAEEEERKKEDLELGGWTQKATEVVSTEQNQPTTDQKAPAQPMARNDHNETTQDT
uniref:Protein FAM177A1 n=1 Tax=Lygus hesperus TaxID=30085 RepID=A0A146MHJ0_LYGHE